MASNRESRRFKYLMTFRKRMKGMSAVFPTNKRSFPLTRKILGNDALQPVECSIKDSICDLCFQFIESSLCKQSFDFPDSRWEWKDFGGGIDYCPIFRHYTTARALEQSAASGCELCTEIFNSPNFEEAQQMVLAGPSGLYMSLTKEDFGEAPTDWSNFMIRTLKGPRNSPTNNNDQEYHFMLAKDEMDCLQYPVPYRDKNFRYPSLHSESEECFNQLRKWWHTCVEQHDKCVRPHLSLPR